MQITLSFDNFTELPYTSGTVQNISSQATVEICQDDTANTGLILGPGEWFSWSNSTVYARSAWDYEPTAICAVVPFKKGGEGGGSEYILPVATKNTLGGVKSSDEAGAIKVDTLGKMTYNAPSSTPLSAPDWETNTAYPENALVEYNDNIYICLVSHTSGTFADDLANGKWKLVSMTLNAATSSELGGVKSNSADGGVTVASDGNMTINLPKATSSTLGGVKIGDGLSVTADGTLSATSSGGGISIWQANTGYEVNDVVIDSNLIWQCATAHTSTSTFDESKWVCLSGGEISNGMEIIDLWEGAFNFSNSTQGATPTSSTPMIELSEPISNFEYILVCGALNSELTNADSVIVPISTINPPSTIRFSIVLDNNDYYSASINQYDSTHLYIAWKVETYSQASITSIQGIRKAKPIVSSGMKYETLWEGEAGNFGGGTDTTINLSDNVRKYKKLGLTLVTLSGSNEMIMYYEVNTSDYIELITNGGSSDKLAYGWAGNTSAYFEINKSSTQNQISIHCGYFKITKVIGISEGVVVPTGVQAARVTLFEGVYATSNQSNTMSTSLTISDSIENYDQFEVTFDGSLSANNNKCTMTYNTSDINYGHGTFRIQSVVNNSRYTTCTFGFIDSTHFAITWLDTGDSSWYDTNYNPHYGITKIVGIKYIQPDSYSTEEKLIGTWIDGKPLYRKVFENPTNGMNTGLDSSCNVKRTYGHYADSVNSFDIPCADIASLFVICYVNNTTKALNVVVRNGDGNVQWVAIEYTKN